MTVSTTQQHSPWLVGRRPATLPAAHLYCFPHSGGMAGEYVRWGAELPGTQVYGIGLPGRAGRSTEAPLTSMPELVGALLDQTQFVAPFVLFGHSLGAVTAFEVTRELRSRGLRAPDRLVLSAAPAPQLGFTELDTDGLSDIELLATVGGRHGGVPDEILANPGLVETLAPAFRADYQLLNNYTFTPSTPLDVPVDAFGGKDDAVTPDHMSGWQEHVTGEVRTTVFEGGHFYFRQSSAEFFSELQSILSSIHDNSI